MQAPVVIIGMGELGGIFARNFLRCGKPAYPITRQMSISEEHQTLAREIATEVICAQESLTGKQLPLRKTDQWH